METKKLFIVCYSVYAECDKNLYTDVKNFSDRDEAMDLFKHDCSFARQEAEWGSDWEEDDKSNSYAYAVKEEHGENENTVHSEAYDGFHVNVKLMELVVD